MKKNLVCLFVSFLLVSCTMSNKSIVRLQHLEEGVDHPNTVEELQDAIKKYQTRVNDIQIANGQVGIWYKMLGNRYLDNKMYGEALKCFQTAIEYYPTNQNLFYWVGICASYMSKASLDYDANGSFEKKSNYLKLAEKSYKRAIEIEPRFARALYALGTLYRYEFEDYENAIDCFENFLQIQTRDLDAMQHLAYCYYSVYKFDEVIPICDKILSLTKSDERKSYAENLKKMALDASYSYED